jgi:hypothetical protein
LSRRRVERITAYVIGSNASAMTEAKDSLGPAHFMRLGLGSCANMQRRLAWTDPSQFTIEAIQPIS